MSAAAQAKHKIILGKLIENPGSSIYSAMRAVGYAHTTALHPSKNLGKNFLQLLDETLPDHELLDTHRKLLQTRRIDHMVFPLSMEDEEIEELISSVGGTLRKIKQGETAKHAYWWVPSDDARQKALKLAYEIKGKLKATGEPITPGNTYNTQINIDNSPRGQSAVDAFAEFMMQQTLPKKVANEDGNLV